MKSDETLDKEMVHEVEDVYPDTESDKEEEKNEEVRGESNRTSKKKKIIKIVMISVGSVAVLVGMIAIAVNLYIDRMLNKVNYVSNNQSSFLVDDQEPEETDDPLATQTPEYLLNELEEKNKNNGMNGVLDEDYVYNIMLLGSDTRSKKGIGATDVMVLLSINTKTKKMYLTSFMRDSYLQISGYNKARLNTAFRKGPEVLFQTLEDNFRIKVDRFVYINFYSFMDVIDEIGGIELDINSVEKTEMNKIFAEINRHMGDPINSGKLSYSGKQNVTGKQALAYARIRHNLKGNDFARTGRQRLVIEKIFDKIKGLSIFELTSLAETICPMITTNLTQAELKELILDSLTYFNYEIEQLRVPMDGGYMAIKINTKEMLGIDLEKNIKYIGSTIYGKTYEEESVTPSPSPNN